MHYTLTTEFTTKATGDTSRTTERFDTIEAAYAEVDRVKADWQKAVAEFPAWADRYTFCTEVVEKLDDSDGNVVTVGELQPGDRVAVGGQWREIAAIHHADGGIVVELAVTRANPDPGMWHYQYDVLGEALVIRQ